MCGFMLVHMDCSVVAMDLKASMVLLQWYFCWIIHGDGFFWRLGFSLNEGFPRYILCHNFVGMLSILLHVDFNCIFISDLSLVMWKMLYYFLQVSLQKRLQRQRYTILLHY